MERNNRWGFTQEYPQVRVAPILQEPADNTVAMSAVTKSVSVLENIISDQRIKIEKLEREISVYNSNISALQSNLTAAQNQIQILEAQKTQAVVYPDIDVRYGLSPNSFKVPTPNARVHVPKTQAATIAQEYRTPVNPMTVFVEFLEEMDILEEYVQKTVTENVSFTVLCAQFMPSEFISAVCVDEDDEILEEWEEAHAIWEAMCETDDLDSKEAYVE